MILNLPTRWIFQSPFGDHVAVPMHLHAALAASPVAFRDDPALVEWEREQAHSAETRWRRGEAPVVE